MKAVLFRSRERFTSFEKKLAEYGIETTILDFAMHDWIEFDYRLVDLVIYYPSFKYSSNHPLALNEVYDNLMFLHEENPHLKMFPDPAAIRYYNDKYRQYLFLQAHKFPTPATVPLLSEQSLDVAQDRLGYPIVVKNRYGAGGDYVFRVFDKKHLHGLYELSTMNLFGRAGSRHFAGMLTDRLFYYHLIKAKRAKYPFLSSPLLAQKFIRIDRDLKTVVGDYRVVEAHWRHQADREMWKMNIDGGGTGVWGKVPESAIELSVRLARELNTTWLNIDMVQSGTEFLITEFSPVWHHYAYREKPTFVYQDDYNIEMPLEVSLDLERIIVESLIEAVNKGREKEIRVDRTRGKEGAL